MAEDTPPPLSLRGQRLIQHRFFPETVVRLVSGSHREHVPALSPYRLGLPLGTRGSVAMRVETTCSCTLCDLELRLLASLTAESETFPELTKSSSLRHYSSVRALIQRLKTSPADARSDEVLRELFTLRATRSAFVESLLILAFVPMLHRTVRRVVQYQLPLAEEDVAQQAVSFLLQFLRSDEMQARQSHFAFAISRAVKRQVFAWAGREGAKDGLLNRGSDIFLSLVIDEPFERLAQLRHFLNRCVTRGDLTDAELDLLVQFKLEGTHGEDFEGPNGHSSNAVRQRLKRLLAKLRRLAR